MIRSSLNKYLTNNSEPILVRQTWLIYQIPSDVFKFTIFDEICRLIRVLEPTTSHSLHESIARRLIIFPETNTNVICKYTALIKSSLFNNSIFCLNILPWCFVCYFTYSWLKNLDSRINNKRKHLCSNVYSVNIL